MMPKTLSVGSHIKIDNRLIALDGIVETLSSDAGLVTVISNPWDVEIANGFSYSGDGRDTFDLKSPNVSYSVLEDDEGLRAKIEASMFEYEYARWQLEIIANAINMLRLSLREADVLELLKVSKDFVTTLVPYREAYKISMEELSRIYYAAIKGLSELNIPDERICKELGISKDAYSKILSVGGNYV